MSKNMNKPKNTPVSIPQQPKALPMSTSQPPKEAPKSAPQQIRDIPRSRPTPPAAPTHDDIAKRAYEIYTLKGCRDGRCEQNWKQAEQELKK
jgi:hypothetical protein